MAPKKAAVTTKSLQALLTRIGSASSGTKSSLLARFQRDVQRPGFSYEQTKRRLERANSGCQKLRIVSIDMGIKNLAFCDAEVSHPATGNDNRFNFDAHMDILRWKKLDLVSSAKFNNTGFKPKDAHEAVDVPDTDADTDLFSPSVLSKTAYRLIVQEVLRVDPDVILIEKQRWRSGGGSAVQQWTVRVNTLEAMLWAILETLKQSRQSSDNQDMAAGERAYQVHAVDPKRVGQYWLGQHARALQERDEDALALDVVALSRQSEEFEDAEGPEAGTKVVKKPSRSKAEKSAKIAILRSWLANNTMSTTPSSPSTTPCITFSIGPSAASTRDALLPQGKTRRRRKTAKTAGSDAQLTDGVPATAEMTKLDDITDCFLQAAAWVAWESNRLQLMAVAGGGSLKGLSLAVDEKQILGMVKECRDA